MKAPDSLFQGKVLQLNDIQFINVFKWILIQPLPETTFAKLDPTLLAITPNNRVLRIHRPLHHVEVALDGGLGW